MTKTNANGKITVPVKSSSGGGSSSGGSSGGGGSHSSSSVNYSFNITVTDKNGNSITGVTNKIDKDGSVIVTLPNGKVIDDNNYYIVTVTDKKGNAQSDVSVTIKDKKDNKLQGETDKNGVYVSPTIKHSHYVVGYDDGEFKPEGNMTRAEAAAIFARNIAERKGESISNSKSSFADVSEKLWYNKYISYLEKYDIIKGYGKAAFKPDAPITRTEFVTMCTRFMSCLTRQRTLSQISLPMFQAHIGRISS